MNSPRGRDRLLGGIGLVCAAIYVLACASFSPDDSQVLFVSYDTSTQAPMVSLYDRKADSVENLFSVGRVQGSECPILTTQWTPDGRHVLAVWADQEKSLRVLALPRKGREPARMFVMPTAEDSAMDALVLGPAVVGPYVFFYGTGGVSRLNLETGQVVTNAQAALLLKACGRRLACFHGPKFELGMMDPESFAVTSVLALPEAELGRLHEGTVMADVGDAKGSFFCVSRDGERLAFLKEAEQGSNLTLTLYRGGKPEGSVAVTVTGGEWRIANSPEWSPDGKTLYAPAWRDVEPKGEEFGILEIPVAGGEAGSIPVFTAPGSPQKAAYQLALSHDGKTIAFSTLYLSEKQWKDGAADSCALFLVDLSSKPRKVKRVPIPLPADW